MLTLSPSLSLSLTVVAGTIPLQISFLVAFSQLVPAHTVTLFKGVLSLRVPRFPLLYIGIVTVLALTPLLTIASLLLALTGFITSWTYLRFFKTVFPDLDSSQPASMRGDASESFAFAEFFPGPVKPVVAALSDQVFGVLVAMRICTPFSAADVSAASGGNHHHLLQRGSGPPGGVRAEAERRRALALKALDQRLHAATAAGPSRSSSSHAPPGRSASPAVQQPQPQPPPSTQTAVTSQPNAMLGETNYNPDHDASDKGEP